jgi:hypothetical protein
LRAVCDDQGRLSLTAVAADEQEVFKRVRFLLTPEIVFIEASVPLMQKAPPPRVKFPPPKTVAGLRRSVQWGQWGNGSAVATVLEQKSAAAAAEQQAAYNNLQPAAAASLRSDGRTTVCCRIIIQIEFTFLSGEEACSPMPILFDRGLSCEQLWLHLLDSDVDMRHKKLCLDTEVLDRQNKIAVLPSVHEQLQATPGFLRITVVCTPWGHLQDYDWLAAHDMIDWGQPDDDSDDDSAGL